ncbi:MAG: T9SS type A sorting domain-containing protein [Flavobacterium sp.]
MVSPACEGTIQTLTSSGGSVNATFVNESFSGSTFPSGWTAVAGAGDTVAITNSNNAGGTANEVRITGNSQTNIITDRVSYGPINSSGLATINLQWNNYLDHYQSNPYAYSVRVQTSTDGTNWHDTSWVYNPSADIGPGLQNLVISTADVGSSTLYIAFTTTGRTFGFDRWSIDNVLVNGTAAAAITWSPSTGLYTDAAATVAYTTGTPATTVYAKPTADVTYTVTATNAAGCMTTNSGSIVVNPTSALPTGNSPQDFTDGQTIADLAVTGTGLIWYSDATGSTVLPTSTLLVHGTTYYVSQTVNGSCESARLPILVENPLSTDDFNSNNFSFQPNPVKNVLNLSYTKEISNVEVYNLLGQRVIANKFSTNTPQVDMSQLSSGTYMVKVTSDKQVKTIKVIKQ